jgi:hypothetical protein
MNFKHAVGFLMLGTIFGLLPRWFPGWCSATGTFGSSARELWLELMSFVQIGLAGGYFLQRVCSAVGSMLEFVPATASSETDASALDEVILMPEPVAITPMRRPALPARLGARAIIDLPATLKAGLLEPRQAA